jgi:hypothetical protein
LAPESRGPALLLLAAGQAQGQAGQRVPEEGARRPTVGQGLGHQGQVDQLQPRASELLGHLQAGDAHLGQAFPEDRIVARVAVEDLAQARQGALVVDELPDGFLEQLLLFRDVEVHFPELRSA